MTMRNEPEQWALDLLTDIIDIGGLGGPCLETDCVECGRVALKIQAAFAEREARLVGVLESARRIITEIDDYMKRPERGDWGTECALCMGELLDDDRDALARIDATLAALKDRTNG